MFAVQLCWAAAFVGSSLDAIAKNAMIPAMKRTGFHWRAFALMAVVLCSASLNAQSPAPQFKVLAFYTGKIEPPHISFVHEANRWFPQMAAKYNFTYEATTNWNQLNAAFLSQYQVVVFLDTRPEVSAQRKAFEDYMEHGGAWMGFHFAGFALTPSDYPQNWGTAADKVKAKPL